MSDMYIDPILKSSSKDLLFFNSDESIEYNPESVTLSNGKITSITVNGETISSDNFIVVKESLEIPGVGFIPPGSVIRFEGKDYMLNFGWHINTSNQDIYSWFMTPMINTSNEEPKCRTLYAEMIDKIDLISFGK